jgi:hypothetical protein
LGRENLQAAVRELALGHIPRLGRRRRVDVLLLVGGSLCVCSKTYASQ